MAITLVQSGSSDSGGSTTTSLSVSLGSGATLGNLLVVAFTCGSDLPTLGAPSSWSQAVVNVPPGYNATVSSGIFYVVVGSADVGQTSWTFTLSSAHSCVLEIEEWSATNGWQSSPLDQTAQGDTVASPIQATIIASGATSTTTQASELWIANLVYKAGSQTESSLTSGWSSDLDRSSGIAVTGTMLSQVASSTGSAQVQYTIGTAQWWAGTVATFKPIIATGESFAALTHGVATAIATLRGVGISGTMPGAAFVSAALTPVVHIIPPPVATPVAARYTVRVRDNTRTAVDQVMTYQRLDIVERFNATGDWAIQVDANDPTAALLVIPGYGISITRTVYNILTGQVLSSRVEMAGPMVGYIREMNNNLLTVHGRDDNVWLLRRIAYPSTSYAFAADTLALAPTLWWRMDATSGTSEADASGHGNTGTYSKVGTGNYTLNQPGLIDDPDTSVLFTGSSTSSNGGVLTQTGTKSPATVTGSFTVFLVVSNGAFGNLCGTRAPSNYSFDIQINSTGLHGDIGNGTTWLTTAADATVTFPTTGPYIICYIVTPTGYTIYLNSNIVGSGTYASDTPVLWDSTHTFHVGSSDGTSSFCDTSGVDEVLVWNSALTDAQVNQVSDEAQSRMNHQAYDNITGDCETVLKHYVNNNLGPGAFPDRIVSGLAIEANAHRGLTVTGNARLEPLTIADGTGLLQTLALAGGGLGFKISNVAGVLTFQVYQPIDRSATVYFSQALDNLLDFTYTSDSPNPETGGNAIIVAGGGQQIERLFEELEDITSVDLWGRAEFFQDARDTTDLSVMVQRGQASLASNAQVNTFNTVISPGPQTVFGVDFDLGDKVSAVIDGVVFSDLVREVDITLQGGAAEVVTPIVGTPGAITVNNALLGHLRAITRSVNALRRLQAT